MASSVLREDLGLLPFKIDFESMLLVRDIKFPEYYPVSRLLGCMEGQTDFPMRFRSLCPVKGPLHVKFPLPNPHDPFSLKPGSPASNLIGVKPHEVEKPPNLTAAIAGKSVKEQEYRRRKKTVTVATVPVTRHK
ncbi:hypothetical protein FRX31_021812 [Thalictrum thalictroides]|uniref:Uncharacterized protein n=1 Tax=Thalictrum thalictroides TaxID=46969 RepID=A0A7J6VUR2_THATH|nr:hypothetical protein FRX31_021812 [Thalictrum thalictroides]